MLLQSNTGMFTELVPQWHGEYGKPGCFLMKEEGESKAPAKSKLDEAPSNHPLIQKLNTDIWHREYVRLRPE